MEGTIAVVNKDHYEKKKEEKAEKERKEVETDKNLVLEK